MNSPFAVAVPLMVAAALGVAVGFELDLRLKAWLRQWRLR